MIELLKMCKNKILFIYLFVFFVFPYVLFAKKIQKFKCGVNNIKQLPATALYRSDDKSGNLKKRKLGNEDNFKDFEITLDLEEFNDQIIEYNLTDRKDFYITGVKKAINTIKSLLKVKILNRDYYLSDQQLLDAGFKKWNKTILGDEVINKNIGMITLGIDLYVLLNLVNSEEIGENMAIGRELFITNFEERQPILGRISINIDYDYYSITNSLEYFETIM